MQKKYTWKKGLLSTTYNIHSEGKIIGHLRDKLLSQTSFGQINNKRYSFRTQGLFNQKTLIVDESDNSVIGEIVYNSWMTKATITIFNQQLSWKYENIWNTKWSIANSSGLQINYSGTSGGGTINSNTEEDLYILSGLFVTNYYWQMTIAIMVAVFVPIYVSVLS